MATWSRVEIFRLINSYKYFECLWNFRCPEYKKLECKKRAWNELSKRFSKSVAELKKKIKYLRCAYVQERKRVDDSINSGAKSYDVHQPALFYFDKLKFLDSVIVFRNTSYNSKPELKVEKEKNLEEVFEEIFQDDENTFVDPSDVTENACPLLSTSIEHDASLPPRQMSPYISGSDDTDSGTHCKKKCKSSDKFNHAMETIVKHATSNAPEETIYSSFGKLIAFQLSQLTKYEATVAMDKIHQFTSRTLLKSLKNCGEGPTKQTKSDETEEDMMV